MVYAIFQRATDRSELIGLGDFLLFGRTVVSNPLRPHALQHTRPPCPLLSPGAYSNSWTSSQWCHPAISSSVVPFSSCPQSFPASRSFHMSQLFEWGGQSTGVSASASVLPMNTQDWAPLGWTGWISLQSKGLSRVFSNIAVQRHQFFSAQPSLQSRETRRKPSWFQTGSDGSWLHNSLGWAAPTSHPDHTLSSISSSAYNTFPSQSLQ